MAEIGPFAALAAHPMALRVRGLIVSPRSEWEKICAEPMQERDLLLRWIGPFSAFFMAAGQIGSIAFPMKVAGVSSAPSMPQALITIVVGTALMIAAVFAVTRVVDALASVFGGKADRNAALKLVTFSAVPFWLSGVFGLAPALWPLTLVGLYAVFVFHRGLGPMLRIPETHTTSHAAATIAAAALIALVGVTVGGFFQLSRAAPAPLAPPPVERFDPKASMPARALAPLLPEALPGGWIRAGSAQDDGGAMGFVGVTVEATYERDGQALRLRIVDLGPSGAASAEAHAALLTPPRDDAQGFARSTHVGGSFSLERVDRSRGRAERLIVVAGRFAIAADTIGTLVDLDDAFRAVDDTRLTRLAQGA